MFLHTGQKCALNLGRLFPSLVLCDIIAGTSLADPGQVTVTEEHSWGGHTLNIVTFFTLLREPAPTQRVHRPVLTPCAFHSPFSSKTFVTIKPIFLPNNKTNLKIYHNTQHNPSPQGGGGLIILFRLSLEPCPSDRVMPTASRPPAGRGWWGCKTYHHCRR